MTERLYYSDSHLRRFTGRVLSCREEKGRWAVTLDRTAFFPEGGGQAGDRGTLSGASVPDTRERDGEILHFCDQPLPVGEIVEGELDWPLRFARMQVHSGEHIVSGTAHRLWGCENVGFHMTEEGATLDFDRELDAEQIEELERRANEAVWENRVIRAFFPAAAELSALHFRQKKELSGDVRLVEVEGVDLCACCAPHVKSTGEIGLIRLTDFMRHRGGVRITMLAGRSAYRDAADRGRDAAALSRLFSAPRDKLPQAAERLLRELEETKAARVDAERRLTEQLLSAAPETEEALCFFLPEGLSAAAMRELAEGGAGKAAICAVFSGDEENRRYVIASRTEDLRVRGREINAALHGRGGGAAGMIQGSLRATRAEILEVFHGESIG